jgi:CBS domain-containing protein
MYVKTILDEKGRNVVTGGPQLTVKQAAVYLHENHIGAIVIVDRNDRIAGIVTERDIVAAVARNGAECLDKPISSIMWGNVYRCGEDQTSTTSWK